LSRVEGHGKVTLLLDENDQCIRCGCTSLNFAASRNSFRGGRSGSAGDGAAIVRHLSGGHHLAASKALDMIVVRRSRRRAGEGAAVDALRADIAVACACILSSEFARSVVRIWFHVAKAQYRRHHRRYPEIAKQGVLLRKYGQEVDPHHGGKAHTRNRLYPRRSEQERQPSRNATTCSRISTR